MSDYYGDTVVPDMLASTEQLTAWCMKWAAMVPANGAALLLAVTPLILDATSGAYYDTDPLTGFATDQIVATALADATCIQALAWDRLNIDPLTGGVVTSKIATTKSIGSARIGYADSAQASDARAAATSGLVPAAVMRLRQVNLLDTEPWTYG